MKFFQKNIVLFVLLLIGIVLSYSCYFQHNIFSDTIVLTSENNLKSNLVNYNAEILEDDQIIKKVDNPSVFLVISQIIILQTTGQLSLPSFRVWQPPRFC